MAAAGPALAGEEPADALPADPLLIAMRILDSETQYCENLRVLVERYITPVGGKL